MLVVTRRIGEEIVIADNICVTVVAINGQSVRVGIAAPHSIRVARLKLPPVGSVGTSEASHRKRRQAPGEG